MKAGWEIKTLGEACFIARGGSPRPIQDFLTDDDDGINWVKISDATASDKYIFKTKQKIKHSGGARSRLVNDGDFLLSNSMSFGRPYIMKTTGCIHDGWLVLSEYDKYFDQGFLYHLLSSPVVFEQFDKLAAGSTVRNLNIELASRVILPIPPLPEQKRLVTLLDEAFESIATAKANAEQNLKNARALFESHLNEVFTKRGEGWEVKPLSHFASTVSTGPFGSLLHKSDYVSEGVPLVNPINIVNGKIIPNEDKLIDESTKQRLQNYVLQEGDVILGRRGEIGRCAVVNVEQAGWICGTGCFFIRPLATITPDFLAGLIRSSGYREQLENASTGATMLNLSNKALSDLSIAVPTLAEQQNLLKKLDVISDETQRLEALYSRKIAALDELKKALLHRAFSGEL